MQYRITFFVGWAIVVVSTAYFCIGCTCNKQKMSIKNAKLYDSSIESVSIPKGGPPQVEVDPAISTFTKWLEKSSALSDVQVSNLVCFIKLIAVNHRPACYLVLAESNEPKIEFLYDVKDLGTTFVWPKEFSKLSKSEFFTAVEHDLLQFRYQCKNENCIFYKASKVALGYRGDDFVIMDFKKTQ